MATIVMLLCLVVMGTFFSLSFVFAFKKKKTAAIFWLVLGFISAFFFYYGLYKGWILIPEQYQS